MIEHLMTTLPDLLAGANQLLSSAITVLAFSLLVYMGTHNLRSHISRTFAILLACMCFTYAGDVALFRVENLDDAIPWLKFQWVGIAFIPAAYLHFSDVLLRMTNAPSSRRRFAVLVAYCFGLVLLMLVLQTEYLVRDPFYLPGITQFRAGSFFWVFTVYFYTTLIWGAYKIYRARARCLTSGARRRMTYLAASFAAPALGVYPYMLLANTQAPSPTLSFIALLFINIGIAVMITVMAYSVAFFDALPPDRVIKQKLLHFLLRGSLMATIVISVVQALPTYDRIWGLPRNIILIVSIVTVIVLSERMISIVKPALDRLIFHQDRLEISWISELDRRLLTTTDLQQALENVLTTLCELLRVRSGFIYNLSARHGPRLETQVGEVGTILAEIDVPTMVQQRNEHEPSGYHFIMQNNFWFLILQNRTRERSLGLLGIEARSPEYDLTPTEQENVAFLIEQAELALEDRRLQQEVFTALESIIPEIERVHRLRSAVRYTGSPSLLTLTESPIYQQEFSQMVRDALTHYWGGPKLTSSPLLDLQLVQEALTEHDGNAVRALRAVLARALEKQRPNGERRMTTAEWLIYNIIDLKFVQGMRVREIAQRLAISESDLYRKQRLAIEEMARTLREMEEGHNEGLSK
jgi:hypothetical protein